MPGMSWNGVLSNCIGPVFSKLPLIDLSMPLESEILSMKSYPKALHQLCYCSISWQIMFRNAQIGFLGAHGRTYNDDHRERAPASDRAEPSAGRAAQSIPCWLSKAGRPDDAARLAPCERSCAQCCH